MRQSLTYWSVFLLELDNSSLSAKISTSKTLSASLYQTYRNSALHMELPSSVLTPAQEQERGRACEGPGARWWEPRRMCCAGRCERQCHSTERACWCWWEHSGSTRSWAAAKRWQTVAGLPSKQEFCVFSGAEEHTDNEHNLVTGIVQEHDGVCPTRFGNNSGDPLWV